MRITYKKANRDDILPILKLCKQLIQDHEDLGTIDFQSVVKWVQRKIELSIDEYTVILVNEQKAGYYHFYRNDEGLFEIDDLYVLPAFQNQGIGTAIIKKCCDCVKEPIILYVFKKNKRAISLYERLGFKVRETVRNSRYIMKCENNFERSDPDG